MAAEWRLGMHLMRRDRGIAKAVDLVRWRVERRRMVRRELGPVVRTIWMFAHHMIHLRGIALESSRDYAGGEGDFGMFLWQPDASQTSDS
jgi:hypothetical protein